MRVSSGRQISRFFRKNPGLAPEYAADQFWETRAIVVPYLSADQLMPLLDDADAVVRRAVAGG